MSKESQTCVLRCFQIWKDDLKVSLATTELRKVSRASGAFFPNAVMHFFFLLSPGMTCRCTDISDPTSFT